MDKSMLAGLDGLPEEDKMRMATMIEQLQLRDRVRVDEDNKRLFTTLAASNNQSQAPSFASSNELAAHTFEYFRSRLRMYNSLVERCFNDCVDNFSRKSLQKQEESCVTRCAEKFLKHSMRVGMRFAELNQGAATSD